MKKKMIFPKYTILSLILFAVFFSMIIAIYALEKMNIYMYISGFGGLEILAIAQTACLVLLTSAAGVFIYKNLTKKILRLIIICITVVVIMVVYALALAISALSHLDKYVAILSDNKQHHIIIGEDAFLFQGGGYIYEKTSFCTMKLLGTYYAESEYHKPFSNNDYFIVWNEENFELHYDYGSGNEEYETVVMNYAK